jgi:protein SCO1
MEQGTRQQIKLFLFIILLVSLGCNSENNSDNPSAEVELIESALYYKQGEELPYLSYDVFGNDTILDPISAFTFRDWNNKKWNNDSLKGTTYVTDFFFTSCPTICPAMTRSMLEVQDKVKANDLDVLLISHSIDPKRDSSETLKAYADAYSIDTTNWKFFMGSSSEYVIEVAMQGYKQVAMESDNPESGGFDHSNHLILVDSNGFMRGVYDGESEKEIDQLIEDLKTIKK